MHSGFADSSKTPLPSEEGLNIDARTAWDFLTMTKGVSPDKITVMGQSLGTGVATSLVASLAAEGAPCRS